MHEEVRSIVHAMKRVRTKEIAKRQFITGDFFGTKLTVVESRWGKVAASVTATHMIETLGCEELLFTGVAGSLRSDVRIGDLVVAKGLIQHDLDASPIFKPMEIPLLGRTSIAADRVLSARLLHAAREFLRHDLKEVVGELTRKELGLMRPKVHHRDIATGDQFIAKADVSQAIVRRVPTAACVEMEGAAFAQVCLEHGVPFGVIRTISDNADHGSPVDYPRFLQAVAGVYALAVMKRVVESA